MKKLPEIMTVRELRIEKDRQMCTVLTDFPLYDIMSSEGMEEVVNSFFDELNAIRQDLESKTNMKAEEYP